MFEVVEINLGLGFLLYALDEILCILICHKRQISFFLGAYLFYYHSQLIVRIGLVFDIRRIVGVQRRQWKAGVSLEQNAAGRLFLV